MTADIFKNMIDLLCVAAHYSQRYGSADGFLKNCSENKLVDHAMFLNKNTTENIVDTFLEKHITALPASKINSKNMIFIWKNYLGEQNIPNIIFYANLKSILKDKYKYEEETDSYLDITSSHLPIVSKFIKFWDTSIIEYDSYLEIDELLILFRQWLSNSKICVNMNELLIIDLIHHYYPDISVVDNKFIQNVKCRLWDKRNDVINALELFKLKCNEQEETLTKSLNEAYEYYTSAKNSINVSKIYFEKIASEIIQEHIDGDGLIQSSWWKV